MQAQLEKEIGNENYKKKKFNAALTNYRKAIELEPNEITYYLNTAAVYFEMENYAECVRICKKAGQVGQENRADPKMVAKALARMGRAYRMSGDLMNAKMAYEKALTEHQMPDYRNCLIEIEKQLDLSEIKKQKGNECFKSGDSIGAIKCYSEAIFQNPTDAKLYSNRAACFTKLMSFDLALKDCNKCIELDPGFAKGYRRKAKALQAMGQISKAMATYEKALEIESNCSEAIDGVKSCTEQKNSKVI